MSKFKKVVLVLSIIMGVSFLGIAISIPFAINDITNLCNTVLKESEASKQNDAITSNSKRINLESSGYWFDVQVKQSADDQVHVEYYQSSLYQAVVTTTEQSDHTTILLGMKQDLPLFNFSIKTLIEEMVSDSRANQITLYIPKDYSLYSENFDGNIVYMDSVVFANQGELQQQQLAEEQQQKYEDYMERTMELDEEVQEYYQQIDRYIAEYMETGAQGEEYSSYDYSQFLSDITEAYNSISDYEKSRIEIAHMVSAEFDKAAAWEKAIQLLEQEKQYDLKNGDLKRIEQEFRSGKISESIYENQKASLQKELEEIAVKRDTYQAEYDQMFSHIGQ